MFGKLFSFFSRDIGIDLGTANTLVYVRGKGIIINEPSVVAINQKTGQVLAVGHEAKKMLGRTPAHISALRPLTDGVISDFEVTEQMLHYFFLKAYKDADTFLRRPRVVIGIPSGVTEVERRAVKDAARNAGSSEVYLVEEPVAAAIGAMLPIHDAVGNMIVDIGGGTTDVAVISLGGVVVSKNLRIAGDRLNQDIVQYLHDEFQLLLGEKTAEDIKVAIGSASSLPEKLEIIIRGRDLVTGLPREILINDSQIREAMAHSVDTLVESVRSAIEETPPELISDLVNRGIMLAGGGSLLRGLDTLITSVTKVPARVVEDPLTAVVRGCGLILENIEDYKSVLFNGND